MRAFMQLILTYRSLSIRIVRLAEARERIAPRLCLSCCGSDQVQLHVVEVVLERRVAWVLSREEDDPRECVRQIWVCNAPGELHTASGLDVAHIVIRQPRAGMEDELVGQGSCRVADPYRRPWGSLEVCCDLGQQLLLQALRRTVAPDDGHLVGDGHVYSVGFKRQLRGELYLHVVLGQAPGQPETGEVGPARLVDRSAPIYQVRPWVAAVARDVAYDRRPELCGWACGLHYCLAFSGV